MKQKNMSRLLQALLLIAGLLGAVFFFAFLPFYGRELVQCAPEYAALFWPCLVWAWAFAVPVFWALFPCWQVFGSIARKGAAFTRENAARLRLKESDRLASVAQMLTALGGRVRELPDGLDILGGAPLTGFILE